ncbi:hypothetical protein KC19_9G048200 [Ceratodon purpureus]|uniref:glycerophosphodiester phosphodiesterase n=1 Tax=Ceratodon purpureus TaxID=3225 RepID=A0A8T0GQE8_CERPU|nr:hypothetical protein KC19_9G048200 [Ceratodon purpureus]
MSGFGSWAMEGYTGASVGLLAEERRSRRAARGREVPRWCMPQHVVAPFVGALIFLVLFVHFLYNAHPERLLGHVAEERVLCARGQGKQWCCGHRGARTLAPENTMAAFLTALKVGANCIEMDVHRTSDGKVAVVHAGHYRSKILPANGYVSDVDDVRVEDTSWDSLQKLDAGSWFDKKFRNERIPQLTSVLETFWDVDVRLIVELKAEKCPPKMNSTQCQRQWKWEEKYADSLKAALVRVQKDHGVGSPRFSLLFTSFNHSLVDELAVTLESLSVTNPLATRLGSGLGYILDPHFNYTGDKFKNTVTWLAPHVSKVTEVEHLWQSSRCVSSWVTDSRETIEQQFRLGVQAVTTNLPSLCPTIKLDP